MSVQLLTTDISNLQQDVGELKNQVKELKQSVEELNERMGKLWEKNEVKATALLSSSMKESPINEKPGKSWRAVKIIGIVAAAVTALCLVYFNRERLLHPYADEECMAQLTQEFDTHPKSVGVEISKVFGGIRGFCSLPYLPDPKEMKDDEDQTPDYWNHRMSSPLMRFSSKADAISQGLLIKTKLDCMNTPRPHCPDNHVAVEQLIWYKKDGFKSIPRIRGGASINGEAPLDPGGKNGLHPGNPKSWGPIYAHLNMSTPAMLRTLKDLKNSGSAELNKLDQNVARNWRVWFLPEKYKINLF